MGLKEKINEISDYFRGIEYFNDALIVKAAFPPQLNVIGNEEKGIKVAQSDDGLWYYFGDKNNIEIEDIFDWIKTTVYVYEEAKKKAALYKAKCDELKQIFGNTSYDKLETLQFVFDEKKPSSKRGGRRKKKSEESTQNENNETDKEEQ